MSKKLDEKIRELARITVEGDEKVKREDCGSGGTERQDRQLLKRHSRPI
jgi:hypothetical protein